MKTGTKVVLSLVGIGLVAGGAYALYGDGPTNLHLYRNREEYMASEELPTGAKMVIVGYDPKHPQAATVEAIVAQLAGKYSDVHFVGLPRDVAIDSVGMAFIGDGWGGVASGSPDGGAFEASWLGKADKNEIEADLNAAVAALQPVSFHPTKPPAGTDSVPIS